MHTYTHVCTCTHTHMHTHTCTHTHRHAHTHARTHAHTHCNFLPNLPALQMSHLPLVLGTLITCEFFISSFVFFPLSSSPLLWYTSTIILALLPVVLDCSTFSDQARTQGGFEGVRTNPPFLASSMY